MCTPQEDFLKRSVLRIDDKHPPFCNFSDEISATFSQKVTAFGARGENFSKKIVYEKIQHFLSEIFFDHVPFRSYTLSSGIFECNVNVRMYLFGVRRAVVWFMINSRTRPAKLFKNVGRHRSRPQYRTKNANFNCHITFPLPSVCFQVLLCEMVIKGTLIYSWFKAMRRNTMIGFTSNYTSIIIRTFDLNSVHSKYISHNFRSTTWRIFTFSISGEGVLIDKKFALCNSPPHPLFTTL